MDTKTCHDDVNQDTNRKRMKELHDKFYELYDNLVERGVNFYDVSEEFYELYIWFEYYNCVTSDLEKAQELYDVMVSSVKE
jgi:hypothetical protein